MEERYFKTDTSFAPPWWGEVAVWAVFIATGLATSYCSYTFWWEVPLQPWT